MRNFTLLAGQNSMGKTTVIQAIFAMLQDGKNPFRGGYMNIGKPSELQNAMIGSREIKFNMQYEYCGQRKEKSKIISQNQIEESGDANDEIRVIYCSADRIGVKDTYEKYLGDDILIGKNCEYVFHYLNVHDEERLDIEKDFICDMESKLIFGGQVDYWLNRIMGYRVKANDGLEYKKYSPSSAKDNWFQGVRYKGKTIMKFRFSRVLRCYGYRKGDRFKVLRLERNHTISDNG